MRERVEKEFDYLDMDCQTFLFGGGRRSQGGETCGGVLKGGALRCKL